MAVAQKTPFFHFFLVQVIAEAPASSAETEAWTAQGVMSDEAPCSREDVELLLEQARRDIESSTVHGFCLAGDAEASVRDQEGVCHCYIGRVIYMTLRTCQDLAGFVEELLVIKTVPTQEREFMDFGLNHARYSVRTSLLKKRAPQRPMELCLQVFENANGCVEVEASGGKASVGRHFVSSSSPSNLAGHPMHA